MKRPFFLLLFSVFLFSCLSSVARADNEYPVAFWGEKHVGEAMALHRALTPADFRASCKSGNLVLSREPKNRTALDKAWTQFSRGPKRLAYCRNQPGKTWYLLGEAPYFMLPEKPGLHK